MNSVAHVTPDYIGHRQRILSKLNKHGYEHFADYEIVEMMLFLIFKRKDTKPLAKKLLRKFGNLSGILNANAQTLLAIEGVGIAVYNGIKIINMLIKSALKSKIYSTQSITCLNDVIDYAKIHMVNLTCEEARIICLNNKNHVINDEVVQRGSIDSVSIYPREIIKICLLTSAKSLILLHNHPSGDPTPSINDQYTTNKLVEACRIMGISFFDHIIIANDQFTSFRALGLLGDTP